MAKIECHYFPIFKDNFQYLLSQGKQAAVVDPGDAPKVLNFLASHQMILDAILITHLHEDHIGGLSTLLHRFPHAKVFASSRSLSQLGLLDPVHGANSFELFGQRIKIIPTPGHTSEQVAFYLPTEQMVFTGDLIFHLGCGRIFDGTLEEQFQSLQLLKQLPDTTQIYCSHDYGLTNLNFFLKNFTHLQHLDKYPALHQIPLLLGEEKKWNPFLTDSIEEFCKLRTLRNQY